MNNMSVKPQSLLEIEYETQTLLRRVFDFIFIPIINSLPASFRTVVRKSHRSADEVVEHATTHQALEALYNHTDSRRSKTLFQRFFNWVWFHTENARAVRNRLKLVEKSILEYVLTEHKKERKTFHFLSIAAGSARAVIDVIVSAQKQNIEIKAELVDKSERAINYSKKLAAENNLTNFTWNLNTVGNYFESVNSKPFDVVEMVGLLDYFDDERTNRVFKNIYEVLQNGGILVTANINHNREEPFITKVIGWEMIYRTPTELSQLLISAGFKKENLTVIQEPFKIHTVIIAKK